jgi:pimeloyl-ACP methyl ester carboxylesterase
MLRMPMRRRSSFLMDRSSASHQQVVPGTYPHLGTALAGWPSGRIRRRVFRGAVVVVAAIVVELISTVTVGATSPIPRSPIRLTHGPVAFELRRPPSCAPDACPLVVLVAGFAVPMVVWDATVPALLAKGFTVLRFDLYGRGLSARPRVEYRPELFAEQMWELVTKLGFRPPFHVIASSMGGVVTAVFAARHPDALDRVVLVSPAGLSHDFPVSATILRAPGVGPWYFTSQFRHVMLDHLRDNVNADVCVYPRMLAAFYRQLEVPGTADAMYSTFRHTLLGDVREDYRWLGRRHRPTLAVWGAADKVVPPGIVPELYRMIPHLEVSVLRGTGHLPQLERPRAFNALVTTFLGR